MYARSFGDVFSPAALIVRASFSLCIRTSSALRLISMPIHDATPCRVIPIRKKMGARSQRRCLPGPIPNPEVKPFCVCPNTVVRESTGTAVTVPLFFPLGYPRFFLSLHLRFLNYVCIQRNEVKVMPIDTLDILGSDQIGIHLASVGKVLFHPRELPEMILEQLETTLQLEMAPISIGGSNLIGALLAGNSNGLAVADIATETDIDELTAFGDVVVMEGGVNTAGNLLLANEQGCVASPSIPPDGLEILADVLGVEIIATTIGGQDVVGSLGVVNDQGVLLHPDVASDEVLLIEEVLGVPPMVGTVSFGSPYVGAGICASNDGAVAGTETTGPELNRIEDALGII